MRKTKKQRLAEQAARQQAVRDQAKENRRPTRDDLARVLLWQMITVAQRQAEPETALCRICETLIKDLNRQGFKTSQVEAVFWELATKYKTGLWPFRTKRHLGV